ncbi:MAG: protein kinase [Polyangiaceae bacterium]
MKKVGSYVLLGEIASGGMASVHLGRLSGPAGFARTVAIKRLHPQFAKDPEFVSMFLDEARLAARIRHPNVVQTLDVVASEGELFLVMDYVEGESLARLLKRLSKNETRIPLPIVSSVVSGVLRGMHAAHEAKGDLGEPLEIVHRDISPQNLIVGADGVVRVLDFGIAKAVGRLQTTREGAIKGKLPYMAPEQLRGHRLSARTDVYAVGVVLWECLVGERLFGGDEGHVVERILLGTIPAPSSRVRGIPEAVDAIVAKATARVSEDRFPDAAAMASALEQAVRPALSAEVASWLDGVAGNSLRMRAARVTAQLNSGMQTPAEALLTPLSGEMSLAEAVQKSGFGGSSGGRAAPTIPESARTVTAPATPTPAPTPTPTSPEPLASSPTGEHENTLNRPLERPIPREDQSEESSLTGLGLREGRRRRLTMGAAFAVASLLGFGLAAWRCGRAPDVTPAPAITSPAPPDTASAVVPPPPVAPLGAEDAAAPAPTDAPAGVSSTAGPNDAGATRAPATARPTGKPKPPPIAPKPTPKRVDCTIPFTVDATGKRVYRRECLK